MVSGMSSGGTQILRSSIAQIDGSVRADPAAYVCGRALPSGAQKALGWFGASGLKPTLQSFTSADIPALFGLLAIAAEFLGPLGIAVGLPTCSHLRHRRRDGRRQCRSPHGRLSTPPPRRSTVIDRGMS
jgi:DoxX